VRKNTVIAALRTIDATTTSNDDRDEPATSRTFHYVKPLDPACDAAWKARAEIRFDENRALLDEMSARRIAIILAGGDPDAAPLRMAA
jgi:hypothetical protein